MSSTKITNKNLKLSERGAILFGNFSLIILAYYHIKPASRSLFIEYLGADLLPYVWIATAVVLGTLIGFYHGLVERYSRLNVVLGSCLLFIATLIGFRILLLAEHAAAAVAFYIFVDIFSVVLVEQFWSLANTVYSTEEGKRWYGFIGIGGLAGGMLGGIIATKLLEHTALTTEDLLLVSALILVLVFAVNYWMGRLGLYAEQAAEGKQIVPAGDWRVLFQSRYLLLIATMLLLSQLCQPIVEFQFVKAVEETYVEKHTRTGYFSAFFAAMGFVSIAVNLVLTPLIHRTLGAIGGLVVQPMVLAVSSLVFWSQASLMTAAVMKVSDRGLSYSINRASKELLYIPVDPVHTYQAKAWIDMLGYRLFKVLGSVLILALTQWFAFSIGITGLAWLTVGICGIWLATIVILTHEYRAFVTA